MSAGVALFLVVGITGLSSSSSIIRIILGLPLTERAEGPPKWAGEADGVPNVAGVALFGPTLLATLFKAVVVPVLGLSPKIVVGVAAMDRDGV